MVVVNIIILYRCLTDWTKKATRLIQKKKAVKVNTIMKMTKESSLMQKLYRN